jgi:hypothetical protein
MTADAPTPDRDDDFHRAAHPVGRLARIFLWVAIPLAFAFQHWLGMGVSILIAIGLMAAFNSFRDKTPAAAANDGLFWRIALGEELWKAGGAPAETAKSIDLFGKFAMGLALLGVALTFWLGPVGLGVTFAYLVVTTVKHRMLAALGDAAL